MVKVLGSKFMIEIGAKARAFSVDPELLTQLPPRPENRPENLPEWNISKEVSQIEHGANKGLRVSLGCSVLLAWPSLG